MRRGGAAFVFSAAAHAAAAVSVSSFLQAGSPTSPVAEIMEVDIASDTIFPDPVREANVAAVESLAASHPAPPRARARARLIDSRAMPISAGMVAQAQAKGGAHMAPRAGETVPVRFALGSHSTIGVLGAVPASSTVSTSRGSAATNGSEKGHLGHEAHDDGRCGDDRCGDDARAEEDVSVPARLVASRPLIYPERARQAEIEADLPLEIVVEPTGRVSAARGLTPAGYGLDETALQAVREYRFSPALRDGHPVRVRMRWTVQFRLR